MANEKLPTEWLAEEVAEATRDAGTLKTELSGTPRWRFRRRARLERELELTREREQRALHLLGADVDWPYAYWRS